MKKILMLSFISVLVLTGCDTSVMDTMSCSLENTNGNYFLRIFIDKPEGVNINDCTDVSHAIDPVIDEADPIDCSYYLEVCSPGIDRELTRPHHFEYGIGKQITVKLFKSIDGKKEFTGVLKKYDGNLTLEIDGAETIFEKGAFSKVYIFEEF